MLYEVITQVLLLHAIAQQADVLLQQLPTKLKEQATATIEHRAEVISIFLENKVVITSYSIHYTKLYDRDKGLPERRHLLLPLPTVFLPEELHEQRNILCSLCQ